MRGVADPLIAARFDAAMAALTPPDRLGLAVSGGSDSLALLYLVHQWARGHDRPPLIMVATVDHGLRPEAADEAAFVAAQAAKLGLPHHILRLGGLGDQPGNLAQNARAARYASLHAWAMAQGLGAILLAHTQSDQAETVLMHLARGSGIDGLAAMAPRLSVAQGGVVLRPLLGFTRDDLRADLAARGQAWVDDPTNADPRYARPRLRALMAARLALGLTDSRLALMASHAARARMALDEMTTRLHAEVICGERFDLARYASAPQEIRLRLLRGLLAGQHPPRAERVLALDLALLTPGFRGRSLGMLMFKPDGQGGLRLQTAPPRRKKP